MALLYDILHTHGLRAQSSYLSRILWKLEGWGCFPGGISGKEPTPANAGDSDAVSIPGLGRSPGEGHGNHLQYSFLENPHVHRSLVGYSLWGCKELDVIERLSTAQHIYIYIQLYIYIAYIYI